MKFGRNLHKQQIPHWADHYLDYNGLKRKIKLCKATLLGSHGVSGFRRILDELLYGINHVQVFYEKAYPSIWEEASRFSLSINLLGQNNWQFGNIQELRFHLGAYLQFLAALEELRWYGTVNSQGFKRLLHKITFLNTHQAHVTALDNVRSKLSKAQFSCQTKVIHDMECPQSSITTIRDILSHDLFSSQRSLILDHFMQQHTCHDLEDPDVIYRAIQDDNVLVLESSIRSYRESAVTDKSATESFLLVLIKLSIIHESIECLRWLILLLESIHGHESIAKNYLPLVVIEIIVKIGQQRMLTDASNSVSNGNGQLNNGIQRNNGPQLLRRFLARFNINMETLLTRDPVTNHSPIYYVAKYGLLDMCQFLLEDMQDGKPDNRLLFSESILLEDNLGDSPLRLTISCGFEEVTSYPLDFLTRNKCLKSDIWELVSGSLLSVAISISSRSSEQLLAAKPDVNYRNAHGETALYIAARSGSVEIADKLLICGANVEMAERSRGWTPLIITSVEGHISVVELILQAGAVLSNLDYRGWTALDHAAFVRHPEGVRSLVD